MSEAQGTAADPLVVRACELAEGTELEAGPTWHLKVIRNKRVHMLEVEDVHFNHDSAVLLADYRDTEARDDDAAADAQDDDQDIRITALAILAAAYQHVEAHPEQLLLIAGHTDRSGSDSYNQRLSLKRAKNVLHLLKGEKEEWADSAQDHHKVEDYQQLLKWLYEDFAWDTDPGDIDNIQGPNTSGATKRFQERYNVDFAQEIGEDGVVGPETWGAFFDVYMQELREVMGLDEAGLAAKQGALTFLEASQEAVGCGENWPITQEHRSRVDRRVELLFFDPGEEPCRRPLACHPDETRCDPDACEIRDEVVYSFVPLPVNPVLAPRFRVLVQMVFVWKDPAEVDHPFPVGFPVTFLLEDGTEQTVQVGEQGRLFTVVDKRAGSFTLEFEHPEASYIASQDAPVSGDPETERLVTRPETAELLRADEGWRVFLLPPTWGLERTDWEVDSAAAPTFSAGRFGQLDTLTKIGTPADPCRMELKPHWQYLKLTYFDRNAKRRHSLPPVVLEGFHERDAAGGEPEAQSNWTTAEGCQCLPWLLRKGEDGSELNKPDGTALLQLRTHADTYVDSTDPAARVLVTKGGAGGDDPGCNGGEDVEQEMGEPSAERLAFYDLPSPWKSRGWFCRLEGGTDADRGLFADQAAKPTSNTQPLVFSLDDLVLTGADLSPLTDWTPNTDTPNRVALFVNTFDGGTDLADSGLYKQDGANRRAYFTERPGFENTRNYIADYPDWTRLVVTQGNLFDVFDKRVSVEPDGPFGARAAVRWVDATHDGVGVAPGTDHPKCALNADASHPFFQLQPFSEQEFFNRGINSRPGDGDFDEWNSPVPPGDGELRYVGRYDLALLRCCDVDGDTEVAVALRYYRFTFDYTVKTNDLDDTALAAQTPAQRLETREEWASNFMRDCANRWNGDDGVNTQRAFVVPKSGSPKVKAQVMSFLQNLDPNESHFKIDCVAESETSNMGSNDGEGELRVAAGRDTDGEPTDRNFAGAHETGHGGSLPDEYPRRNNGGGQTGFGSNHVPGAIYRLDNRAMMKFNHFVRARYFWHVAEWMRLLPQFSAVDLKVEHGTEDYELPHYQHQAASPKRNYVYWPVKVNLRHSSGDPVLYDSYLYMLGKDRYRTSVLPSSPGGDEPDGFLQVIVKARFEFDGWIDTEARRERTLNRINQRVENNLNTKVFAAFRVAANPDAPPAFTACVVNVSCRFRLHDSSANEHLRVRIRDSGSTDFDDDDDPRELDIRVAGSEPPNAGAVNIQINNAADTFFDRFCELVGLSSDTSQANAFDKADAYIPLVRSVAGAAVTPTMSRLP